MIQFLSTQILLDLLTGKPEIVAWQKSVSLNSVEVSAVSIGQAFAMIAQHPNAGRRQALSNALRSLISAMTIHQGIIPLDESAAEHWATLQAMALPYDRPDGTRTELSVASRMVVASALSRDAVLIEYPQPYHSVISGLQTAAP